MRRLTSELRPITVALVILALAIVMGSARPDRDAAAAGREEPHLLAAPRARRMEVAA
jgi:hypothetical protein